MPMYCHRITVSYFKRIPSNKKNKCVTINDKNDTTLYHETPNVQSRPSLDRSDFSPVLRPDDIFTLRRISASYSKFFVHALHDVPHDMRLFLVL
jgi:hypothetical protein